MCYEINAPIALGEVIDGEAILLHLEQGNYFSTKGSGALIWAGIEQKAAADKISEALQSQYGLTADQASEDMKEFISKLADYDLIRECRTPAASGVTIPPGLDAEYSVPLLETYTDMQDLLLMDPIHGVDETGWPLPPKQDAA
jgi:hypothetical protein